MNSYDRPVVIQKRNWMNDPRRIAESLVAASHRYSRITVAVFALLALAGAYVTATRFAITTETDQLLESDSVFHQNKVAYEQAFPHLAKVIVAVVDADSSEAAERAAAALADALNASPGTALRRIWRPDGGAFFDQNGLLLLPLNQLKATLEQLQTQQQTLVALSGDPSLRGLMRLLQIGAGRGALDANTAFVTRLADVVEQVLAGRTATVSWQNALAGQQTSSSQASNPQASDRPQDNDRLRRFVLVDPILDYNALQPALQATNHIRAAASELHLTPDRGISVRLTGLAPLADEEFVSVREGAPLHLGLTVIAIAIILFLALRSGRVIFAVLATTFAGLIITIGLGLLMVGRFNVISIAVAALFLGLGVDFGIQVAVRYRDERHKHDNLRGALLLSARGIGWSLTLAALSLLAGFFAFLPTSFRGVSELGLITGVGMIVAFFASLTLLPALLSLLNPPGESDSVEMPALAAVDHWIHAHRRMVISASLLIVLAGLPFLLKLEFDANPMHLRSDKTEAVATFLDLTRQQGSTPNTINVLAPTLGDARALAAKLSALPEVDRVVTLATFVPDDQQQKLALIAETAAKFRAITNPRPPAPPPTDAELIDALRAATVKLREQRAAGVERANDPVQRLVAGLETLTDAAPAQRAAAQAALVGDLPQVFHSLRTILGAQPITIETLPPSIREDWQSRDGKARIEVFPKGDANDNVVLERFVAAAQSVAPNISGAPVTLVESRGIIVRAFVTAGILALVAVFIILTVALRNAKDVALTLGPLVLATMMTLEAAQLIGMPLNLANIIALPLMLAVGVNFHIYYMIAWRNGMADMLASSLTRAIFFSAMTTGVAFGSLWLSSHPGTASMGKLLTLSLFFTLLAAFIIVPAFLGPPRRSEERPH